MGISKSPMTPAGEKALRITFDNLIKKLNEVADKIAHAKAFGDLSENAEYISAKQEQALLMQQSQSVSNKLRNNQVIDPKKLAKNGKVVFGTTVYLNSIDHQTLSKFQIVGEDEADIKTGKISFNSPIARGIIGKMEGDHVKVNTLEGIKAFEIKKVEYL